MMTDAAGMAPPRTRRRRTRSVFRNWDTGAGHALMILVSLVCVFPIYWMIVTSLRPANEIFSTKLWPDAASLENYAYALQAVPMQQMLIDTLGALILPHFASAFAIMLLAQSMRSFPSEVIEAARMDGANHAHILWQVVVPNLRGTIASLSILIFITTWNEYFWPLLLTRSPENSVVQIGLQMFISAEGTAWGPLMAASTMASLPILLIYLVLQRQVIASFMKSGLR